MFYCERCGNFVDADGPAGDYCVRCGLYVCADCWDSADACTTCKAAAGRRTFTKDLALLRRVDRRLREVGREAGALNSRVASRREPTQVLTTDLACLRLKAAAAARVRDRLLTTARSARNLSTLTPLVDRIAVHAAKSESLLSSAGRATEELDAEAARSRLDEDDAPPLYGRLIRRSSAAWIPALGAAAGVAVVAVAIAQAQGIRESVLGGGLPSPSPASSPEVRTDVPASSPVSSPSAVIATFDDQRIGSAAGWEATSTGSIAVVALPTSFDRSLEVRSTEGTPIVGCLALDDPVELGAFDVDLLLSAPDPGTAAVTFVARDAVELLRLEVGTDAATASLADGSSASASGIAPEEWFHVGLTAREGGYDITLAPRGGVPDGSEPMRLDTHAPGPIAEVCLALEGPPGATAHYDNLALHGQSPLEG
jgi:hypothetical protein